MLNLPCNIQPNERVTRIIIGAVLLLAALLGLGHIFLFLVAIVLIVEGIIGWCGIPILAEKFKLNDYFKKKDDTDPHP
jgi:MFS-type transporter involved in bile tolerance (Atg22 family)